jgi:2-methylisocitrate lyase-like PEP mutase family enzyme
LIVDAVDLPVAADLENGFGDAPEAAAETIRLAGEQAGLVGGSIEDATGDGERPIYDFQHAVERVTAAAEAAHKLPFPFTLVGRAEGMRFPSPNLDDVILRLQAFEAAGADVLFAPGLPRLEDIRTVCAAVTKPVNVVMGYGRLQGAPVSVAGLAALGVKRVSVGAALSRVALGAFLRAAQEIHDHGTFSLADQGIPTGAIKDLVAPQKPRLRLP